MLTALGCNIKCAYLQLSLNSGNIRYFGCQNISLELKLSPEKDISDIGEQVSGVQKLEISKTKEKHFVGQTNGSPRKSF